MDAQPCAPSQRFHPFADEAEFSALGTDLST
jgi:hypothetical protein